jgi:hypothetical protein
MFWLDNIGYRQHRLPITPVTEAILQQQVILSFTRYPKHETHYAILISLFTSIYQLSTLNHHLFTAFSVIYLQLFTAFYVFQLKNITKLSFFYFKVVFGSLNVM